MSLSHSKTVTLSNQKGSHQYKSGQRRGLLDQLAQSTPHLVILPWFKRFFGLLNWVVQRKQWDGIGRNKLTDRLRGIFQVSSINICSHVSRFNMWGSKSFHLLTNRQLNKFGGLVGRIEQVWVGWLAEAEFSLDSRSELVAWSRLKPLGDVWNSANPGIE